MLLTPPSGKKAKNTDGEHKTALPSGKKAKNTDRHVRSRLDMTVERCYSTAPRAIMMVVSQI